MPKSKDIINILEKARRLTFSSFEEIILEPRTVKVLINLFLHPGCKSDISLAKFLTNKSVLLSDISPHIITAFPSQIASYAERKGITEISEVDILECFALDHADAVDKNQAALLMSPAYALAHVLTTGIVGKVSHTANRQLVDLQVKICNQTVNFSHVLVPADMAVRYQHTVFHHFGVVVSVANTKKLKTLARQLQREQNKKSFLQKTVKQVLGEHINDIDYAKESFFKVDMTGQILNESKRDVDFFRLWQEEDLKKIKIPKAEKVMFSS